MNKWNLKKLDSVCLKITDGAHASPLTVETGLPMASVKDLTEFGISIETCRLISETEFRKLVASDCRPQVGDVLISKDGNSAIDTACVIKKQINVVLLSSIAIIRPNPRCLNSIYLKQLFSWSSYKQYLKICFTTGAAIPRVILKDFKSSKLPIPPLSIQRKIAAALSAYDDLIENNNRRIAILEKMAEELYREWFVRLRFPGHEKVKIVKGVPEGWEVKDSLSLLNVLGGGTPKTDISNYWDGEIPFFTPRDAGSGYFAETTDKNITHLGLEKCNSKLFPKNTIFITARGTVGKIVLSLRPMAMNQSCYALEAKSGKNIYYYFLAMRNAVDIIKGTSNSGVFDNIVTDSFKQFDLYQPNEQILSLFERNVRSFFKQLESRINSNSILKDSRDRLLTRLMSGKIYLEKLDIHFPQSMLDETAGESGETYDAIPSKNRNADTRR